MKENIVRTLNISEETILRAVRSFLNEHNYNLTKNHLNIDEKGLHFKNSYSISPKQAGISNYNLDDSITETVEVTIEPKELNEIMQYWYSEKEPKVTDVKIEIEYFDTSMSFDVHDQTGEYHVSGTAIING